MTASRRSYQQRGRAALIGAIALFTIGQQVAGWWIDTRGLSVRFPSAVRVVSEMTQRERPPDIVILGSSRFEALQATEISRLLRASSPERRYVGVSNACVPIGDPIAEQFVLEQMLAGGVKPRLVVVEISPDTLNRIAAWHRMHIHRQVTWGNLPTFLGEICRAGELPRLIRARVAPLFLHRRELLRTVSESARVALGSRDAPKSSSCPASEQPDDLASLNWEELLRVHTAPLTDAVQAELRQRNERHARKEFRTYRPGGLAMKSLDRLLQRCHAEGIEVILVGAPKNAMYRENFTPEVDRLYGRAVERMTARYGCRFIDCRDSVPDQLFRDYCHLNTEGSLYFSRRLTHDVLCPWLRERERAERTALTSAAESGRDRQ